MTSIEITMIITFASIVVSFFYGLITRNYSTVDRIWSLLPPVYVLVWMRDYYDNPRFVIAAVIVVLWGARLTANFAIKGGYAFSPGKLFIGEDYRWEVLRSSIPNRFLFELFNLFFISFFQLALIFMFSLPLYYYGKITGPIKPAEVVLYIVHLALLSTELYADVLQLRFYNRRNLEPWSKLRRYRLGFNTFGIWRFSRHPNYVCEVGQCVYAYLYAASGRLHFSGIGAAVLVILFIGSTVFAESITAEKYPEYGEWKRITSVWIPVKSLFNGNRRRRFLDDGRDPDEADTVVGASEPESAYQPE